MIAAVSEQRNPYKGDPPRPWIRVQLVGPAGNAVTVELIADIGSPCSVIIAESPLLNLRLAGATGMVTNFGQLKGGWLRVAIPEIQFDAHVIGYGGDAVAHAAARSDLAFSGVGGLPLLRLLAFGGDNDEFWIGDR